jgi:hypothetical protein
MDSKVVVVWSGKYVGRRDWLPHGRGEQRSSSKELAESI